MALSRSQSAARCRELSTPRDKMAKAWSELDESPGAGHLERLLTVLSEDEEEEDPVPAAAAAASASASASEAREVRMGAVAVNLRAR